MRERAKEGERQRQRQGQDTDGHKEREREGERARDRLSQARLGFRTPGLNSNSLEILRKRRFWKACSKSPVVVPQ